MRLDKFLTETGICTRSQAKKYIKSGNVTVNGEVIKKSEVKINELIDVVCLDGKKINYNKFEYYMLNKPAGTVSATTDSRDKTVIQLIDSSRRDLFPVGRLDKDTEGLLLITNDGELAHNLLSPRKHVDKKYFVIVTGNVTDKEVDIFSKGVRISEEFTAKPAMLDIIKADNTSEVYVTIQEGKYHQVKKMFIAVGMKVEYLKRVSMKTLVLDESLAPGEYRHLTDEEIQALLYN